MNKLLLISLILSGCVTCPNYNYHKIAMQSILDMTCEDATFLGYTSAYLGKEKWHEIIESYDKARAESKYDIGCGKFNGHWLGRKIYKEHDK